MSKSTPKPPDFTGAAEATAQSSREVTEQQSWANRPDQQTPWGSQTWGNTPTWDPSTGQYLNRWTQTTNLNPEAQAALDSQLRLQRDKSQLGESLTGRMQNEYGSAMDWSGFTPMAPGAQADELNPEGLQRELSTEGLQNIDPSQRYSQQANDAIYGQWADRALPEQTRQTDALRTQLYNQGLTEGDEAYDNEMRKMRESQGDQQRQAQYQATIGAGQEASRMFGMDAQTRQQMFGERGQQGAFGNQAAGQAFGMQGQAGQQNFQNQQQMANYQNQMRQQQISEQMQQRGFSLNEINALMSGQQVSMPQMPGFSQAQRSDATDYSGAAGQQWGAAMDQYGMQQAQNQALMSGAGGLAGGFMNFSDRRLKRNIKLIGSYAGHPLYSYEYIWGQPGIGVMADEVEHIPGAVVTHRSGFKMVNYGRL